MSILKRVLNCTTTQCSYLRCVRALCTSEQSSLPSDGSQQHWYELETAGYKSREDAVQDLKSRVLHDDDHLLIINKPHGFPMRGQKYTEHSGNDVVGQDTRFGLVDLVADVCCTKGEEFKEKLSLNRLHSGITVFTKNSHAAMIIEKYFRHCKAHFTPSVTYKALSVGHFKTRGVERLCVERKEIGGRLMPVVAESNKTRRKSRQQLQVAFSPELLQCSEIEDSRSGAKVSVSFLSIQPSSPKWNAVELFMVHKLCPLLGDHQLSSRLSSVLGRPILKDPAQCCPQPQRLPSAVLSLLDVGPEETSLVPLHLHAHSIRLPDLNQKKGSSFITYEAPLPSYFKQSLDKLGFFHQ